MSERRLDTETQTCVCALCPNMCRFLCPVAAADKVETVTPRGKATLVLALERGRVPWGPEAAEVAYRCAGCRVCREWCPSDVDLPEMLDGLRVRAAREGLAPEPVRLLAERLTEGRSLHRPASELAGRMARYREMLSPEARVLYFAGCSTAALYPEVVAATLRLFEAAGTPVTMLGGEECCGLPLDVLGWKDAAAGFARRLAEAVKERGIETVVSGCPMCTYMMKERFGALGADLEADVKHVAEFFAERLDDGSLRPAAASGREAAAVTYHDPCYLGRYQGVYDAPRRLLAEAAGLVPVEMERSRELGACCGGAPSTASAFAGTANLMASRRLEEAARTGARVLVTACPHCLEMLRPAAADAAGGGLEVLDLAEALAAGLGVLPGRAEGGVRVG
ncbi:MAG TPA: hypothetical protein DGR79_03240 [Clostridiales bacterium]|nr:hypothetical protein [Clostridiales bacterium]